MKPFKLIRLAYLDELEEDPEVQSALTGMQTPLSKSLYDKLPDRIKTSIYLELFDENGDPKTGRRKYYGSIKLRGDGPGDHISLPGQSWHDAGVGAHLTSEEWAQLKQAVDSVGNRLASKLSALTPDQMKYQNRTEFFRDIVRPFFEPDQNHYDKDTKPRKGAEFAIWTHPEVVGIMMTLDKKDLAFE